ncbi:hypothetical protein LINPERHAP2_LOCUS25672 [Linum perenne]
MVSVVAGESSTQTNPRSYLGAVRGDTSSPSEGNQAWIPVGVNDIILSASNGIKSLSLSKDFKEKLCKPWFNSVVVRLLGKNVGYPYLCHRLRAIWKPVGNIHIVDLDRSCFLVKFAYEQDYFKALTGGPWTILDHYKMVAWVRFLHLPIHFYHAQVLTSLGNLIGKTVKIDFNTQRAERGRFARIAIELDLSEPLPPTVLIDGVLQNIEYANLPNLCFSCGRIGHESKGCPRLSDASLGLTVEETALTRPIAAVPVPVVAPAPDRYGPWMLVSCKQRRTNKESVPPLVRQDRQADFVKGLTEIVAPVKERQRGGGGGGGGGGYPSIKDKGYFYE